MRTRIFIFASILFCSLFSAVGGDGQSPDVAGKPVWTLEIIRVRPDNVGLTLGYLDDNWMRVRQEAKHQGAVLSYHRFAEGLLVTPGSSAPSKTSIVLLTEYKNTAAFLGRDKLFASILEHLPSSRPGVIPAAKREDLYESVETRVLLEEPDEASTQFKLLAKQ
jgi:hypothetical protein